LALFPFLLYSVQQMAFMNMPCSHLKARSKMIRPFLAFLILMVGLVGCNMPGAPDEGTTSIPTNEQQIINQPAEVTGDSTLTPIPIVPIPASAVQIEGAAYTAYQIPGDPFRFVCQDPCPLDEQYIFAEYAAFRVGHARLIELTGVDTLAELQPVDMHLVLEDSICADAPWGHAYVYAHAHQAYTCTDGPGYYPTMEEKIQKASQVEEQYFPLHEYMHTIFFGRLSGDAGIFEDYLSESIHDFVVPLPAYATGYFDPAEFCSYRDPLPPGDYGGWLISELCQQNGFQLPDLAQSLIALDNLYQSGGGQVVVAGYQHPVPTMAQYRDILNSLLGSDTTNAFATACWPPGLFGNSYSLPPACIVPSSGTATPAK
jgi:hypothetical protein